MKYKNLVNYIKEYGNLSFKDKPFNDVDAVILSTAVYSNFEVVAPSFLDEVSSPTYFKDIKNFDLEVVTSGKILSSSNKQLIPAMRSSLRFGNISIQYIKKVLNIDLSNQFYACTYYVANVGYFIAFRGTDTSVAGWKENLLLGLNQVTLSQLDAVSYLEEIAKRVNGPIYVGGHSKGGNLALYGVLNASSNVKKRIAKVYSFDGNGFYNDDYKNQDRYKQLKDRIVLIRPDNSYIGQIMYNPDSSYIVKTSTFSILQHDTHSWKINDNGDGFIRTTTFNKDSIRFHYALINWLKKVSKEDIELIINFIIKLLGGPDKTIFDIGKHLHKSLRYLFIFALYKKEERERIEKALFIFNNCIEDEIIKEIKEKRRK